MTDETEVQPRPVVDAAESQKTRSRWLAAATSVFGALPTFLLAFGVIAWTPEMIAAYATFLGVVTGAVSVLFGQNDVKTALVVEAQVTPTTNPRDDALVPLVPIADEAFEG